MRDTQDARTSRYEKLRKGSKIHPDHPFRVGDLVEVAKEGSGWVHVGVQLYISNLTSSGHSRICLTDRPPDQWPKGHIAHGWFVDDVSFIKLVYEPVTPDEEKEVIRSILKGSDVQEG